MGGEVCAEVLGKMRLQACKDSRNVCIATNYLQTLWRLHVSANMAWVELEGRICVGQTFLFCGGEDFFQWGR